MNFEVGKVLHGGVQWKTLAWRKFIFAKHAAISPWICFHLVRIKLPQNSKEVC